MKLWYKALILVSIPLLAQFVLGGFLLYEYSRVQQCEKREDRARKILSLVTQNAKSVGVASVWIKQASKPTKESLHAAFVQVKTFAPAAEELNELLRGDPAEQAAGAVCQQRLGQFIDDLKAVLMQVKLRNWLAVLQQFKSVEQDVDPVIDALRGAIDRELSICNQLQDEKNAVRKQTSIILACGMAVNVLLAGLLLIFFSRSAISHLNNVLLNVNRLAQEKPPLPPLGASDEFAFLDRSLHDLSKELLKLREREKALIAESPGMIFAVSSQGRITSANPAALRAFSLPDGTIEPTFSELFASESQAFCATLMSPPSTETVCNTELKLAGGSETTIAVSALWCPLEDQWFCVAEDVTAQKEAVERRRQIAVMVNHDLRTPLTAILAVYDLAKTPVLGSLNQRQQSLVSDAGVEGSRMLNLINSLLDLEKIAAGKFELQFERISLLSVIDEAANSAADVLSSRRLDLQVDVNKDFSLHADHKSLVRIVSNLLFSAAAKAEENSAVIAKAEAPAESATITLLYSLSQKAAAESDDFDFELSLSERLSTMHGGKLETATVENKRVLRVILPMEQAIEKVAQAC